MSEARLTAELREATGKGVARKLRRDGRIPAVVYGGQDEPIAISVGVREFFRAYQQVGTHSLLDLQITNGDGARRKVLIKEVQHNPVRDEFVHVDFHAVSLDEEMQTTVPVELEGEDLRKDNGVVQLVLQEVKISCLPTDIPETLVVNVADLVIGDVVTVGQLTAPKGVTILNEPEEAVVSVTPPRVDETAEGEVGEEEAQGEE